MDQSPSGEGTQVPAAIRGTATTQVGLRPAVLGALSSKFDMVFGKDRLSVNRDGGSGFTCYPDAAAQCRLSKF